MENNHPEKIVIIAGPTFGSAMSFMLFGAALGAAGALYAKSKQASPASSLSGAGAEAAVAEAKTELRSAQLNARLGKLAKRVKSLAVNAKSVAQVAGATALPTLRNAVEEGKRVAHGTQAQIEDELKNEPDTVYATPSFVKEEG